MIYFKGGRVSIFNVLWFYFQLKFFEYFEARRRYYTTNLNNAKSVKNTADFEEAMKDLGDKKHIILIVRQQNFQRYYTVKMN